MCPSQWLYWTWSSTLCDLSSPPDCYDKVGLRVNVYKHKTTWPLQMHIFIILSCICNKMAVNMYRLCVESCPEASFMDATGTLCHPCVSPCQRCNNDTGVVVCTKCDAGFRLLTSRPVCLADCASSYYFGRIQCDLIAYCCYKDRYFLACPTNIIKHRQQIMTEHCC